MIGMMFAAGIELFFVYINKDMINHTAIFMWQYVFPYTITTFFIYGLMPSIAEALYLSRVSDFKDSTLSSKTGSVNHSINHDRQFVNLKDIKIGDLEHMQPNAE